MILLTQFELTNLPTEIPSQRDEGDNIIGIDAWSVITVEKLMYNGGSEGSKVFIGDGRGYINVRELMTDVIHMIEMEKSDDE